jgi:O-antigen/teichoic acid export membrane protein
MVYIAQSSFWLSLNQGIAIMFSAVLSLAFANLIPAEQYGMYKYILSVSVLFGALSLTGMNTAITRSVAMGKEGYIKKSFWDQLKWNTLVIGILALGVGMYYIIRGNVLLGLGVFIIGLCTPLTNAANTFSAYLGGKKEYKKTFFFNFLINSVTTVLLLFVLLFIKKTLVLILVFFAGSALATLWAYIRTIKTSPPNTEEDPHTKSFGQHLSVINFFSVIANNIDKVLIFQVLGATPLAIYSFATAIPAQFGGIAKIISTMAFPKITERYATTQKIVYKDKVLKLIALFSFFAVVYILIAPYIYKIFFPQYISAISYSQYASLIFIFTAPSLYLTGILQIKANKRILYQFTIVTSIIQSILMAWLGYTFGITGLITAHLLSNIIDTIFAIFLLEFKASKSPTPQQSV